MTTAVVIGAGLGGLLAVVALSRTVDRVTVVDSDRLPHGPVWRRGVPQARQNHMLAGGGVAAIDQLLPGTSVRLLAAGAHRLKMADQILTLSSEGWFRRFDEPAHFIACSRSLIDHVIRERVRADPCVELLESTRVVGLTGDADRVTGVLTESAEGPRTLQADLVVDSSGSRSGAVRWLTAIGVPAVAEEFLDPGLAYASRILEASPKAVKDLPGVLIQPRSHTGRPGRGAAFMPQEDGRWIVNLIGTQGGRPPTAEEGFEAFARSMPHPIIAEIMATGTPVDEIRGAHGLGNRRRYFERVKLPEGFVAIGDSVAVISPNYATGMSVAAQSALALRTQLKMYGTAPGLTARVQKAVGKIVDGPWRMAIASDRGFPGVKTNIKLRSDALARRGAIRWSRTVAENRALLSATYEIASLSKPAWRAMTPRLMLAILRGPRRRPLTDEEAIAQFPEITSLLADA